MTSLQVPTHSSNSPTIVVNEDNANTTAQSQGFGDSGYSQRIRLGSQEQQGFVVLHKPVHWEATFCLVRGTLRASEKKMKKNNKGRAGYAEGSGVGNVREEGRTVNVGLHWAGVKIAGSLVRSYREFRAQGRQVRTPSVFASVPEARIVIESSRPPLLRQSIEPGRGCLHSPLLHSEYLYPIIAEPRHDDAPASCPS